MTTVNILVVELDPADSKEGYRWSVSRDGKEVECGLASDEDAAYEAAKSHFEILRTEMRLAHGQAEEMAKEPS